MSLSTEAVVAVVAIGVGLLLLYGFIIAKALYKTVKEDEQFWT